MYIIHCKTCNQSWEYLSAVLAFEFMLMHGHQLKSWRA